MAVVKLSSSKKALLFVDEEGNVFATSVSFMKQLIYGYKEKNMILLTRFAGKVSTERFQQSPVYDGQSKITAEEHNIKTGNDSFSPKVRNEKEQEQIYNQNFTDF